MKIGKRMRWLNTVASSLSLAVLFAASLCAAGGVEISEFMAKNESPRVTAAEGGTLTVNGGTLPPTGDDLLLGKSNGSGTRPAKANLIQNGSFETGHLFSRHLSK